MIEFVVCSLKSWFQVFSFTMDNEIRIDDLCLDVSKSQGPVTMVKCHHLKGNQFWEYNQKVRIKALIQFLWLTILTILFKTRQLVHTNSKQCLEKPLTPSQNEVRYIYLFYSLFIFIWTKSLNKISFQPRMTSCDGTRESQRWSFHNTTIPGYSHWGHQVVKFDF